MQIIETEVTMPRLGTLPPARADSILHETGRKLLHYSIVLEHLLNRQDTGELDDLPRLIRQINYQAAVELEINPEQPQQRKYKYEFLTITVKI